MYDYFHLQDLKISQLVDLRSQCAFLGMFARVV